MSVVSEKFSIELCTTATVVQGGIHYWKVMHRLPM